MVVSLPAVVVGDQTSPRHLNESRVVYVPFKATTLAAPADHHAGTAQVDDRVKRLVAAVAAGRAHVCNLIELLSGLLAQL